MGEGGETYTKRLDEIRKLPQIKEFGETVLAKKEAAVDFRIETYYSNADLSLSVVQTIRNEPNILTRDLRDKIWKKLDSVSRKDVGQRFVRELDTERVVTQESSKKIFRMLGYDKVSSDPSVNLNRDIGIKIFNSITESFPKGVVDFNESVLGIVLCVNESEDLRKLRKSEINIGGFYRNRQKITLNGQEIQFPLIVVKNGSSNGRIFDHENGHAVNQAMFNVLEKVSYQMGSVVGEEWEIYDFINRWGGRELVNAPEHPIKRKSEFKSLLKSEVMQYALGQAKDELLADLVATGNFDYLEHLTEQDGIYNYIYDVVNELRDKSLLDLSPNDYWPIATTIWKKYVSEIRNSTKAASKYLEQTLLIEKELHLSKKSEFVPFVLSQIPITEWKHVLNDFTSELVDFRKTFRKVNSEIKSLDEIFKIFSHRPEVVRQIKEKREFLWEQFGQILVDLRDHPAKSFNPDSRRLNKSIKNIKKEVSALWKT